VAGAQLGGPCRLDEGEDGDEIGVGQDPLEPRHLLGIDGHAIGHGDAVADELEQRVIGMLPRMAGGVVGRRLMAGRGALFGAGHAVAAGAMGAIEPLPACDHGRVLPAQEGRFLRFRQMPVKQPAAARGNAAGQRRQDQPLDHFSPSASVKPPVRDRPYPAGRQPRTAGSTVQAMT
jgi:hypothetical protein